MDAETTRLIVTAVAAVVAGLGGAGLTGFFNRKNTAATLEAARLTNEEQWRRTRERDHEIWLRDNRMEAYTAFFDAAAKMHTSLSLWPTEELKYETVDDLQRHRARILLIGSEEIRQRARPLAIALGDALVARNKVYRATSSLTNDQVVAARTQPNDVIDDWNAQLRMVRQEIFDFSAAVRLDLATAIDQDTSIGSHDDVAEPEPPAMREGS